MSTTSVTIITPAWTQERSVDVPDWDNATETVEAWTSVQPLSATEASDMGRQGISTLLKAFGPADSVCTARTRVRIASVVYEVVSCESWPSLTGNMAHVEAVFERVEG